jgi:hypothetical protein
MKKIYRFYLAIMILIGLFAINSCNLDEEIKDEFTPAILSQDTSLLINLIAPPLAQLRGLWLRENFWGMQEATSDELCFPTRGTDWLDGGVWQEDYLHQWSPTHRDVIATWNTLNTALSAANTALASLAVESPSDSRKLIGYRGQVLFLRAFYEYCLYDLYRVYFSRDPFNSNYQMPPEIMKGDNGFYHLVSTVKSLLPKITTREEAGYGIPNRDAALMLLSKLYLNKEVYTGVSGYDSCLIYVNELINTGHYGLASNYFNMFGIENFKNYKKADDEAIFVAVFDDGDDYGLDNRVVWATPTLHYNMTLSGYYPQGTFWNGCMSPEGFLQQTFVQGSDTATDIRWRDESTRSTLAINLGFIYGQQYDLHGKKIYTRDATIPLNFSFDCPLEGAAEKQGVRVIKYAPKANPVNVMRVSNDFLIWRYADALLMKAECEVRVSGDVAGAVDIVNQIRAKRNAPIIAATSVAEMLTKLLDERGAELYWEGHRRQDQIRFGTYLLPKTNKDFASPSTAVLLPIPQNAIDVMDGLIEQNQGY